MGKGKKELQIRFKKEKSQILVFYLILKSEFGIGKEFTLNDVETLLEEEKVIEYYGFKFSNIRELLSELRYRNLIKVKENPKDKRKKIYVLKEPSKEYKQIIKELEQKIKEETEKIKEQIRQLEKKLKYFNRISKLIENNL